MVEEKLAKIVGARNVMRGESELNDYAKNFSFVNAFRPRCIVKAETAGQIEKIVKLANDTATPLVPVSSGPPHFRGDTVPGTGGAVVVDLSGMKKITRVDRTNRVAMFEPGVTYSELIAAVAKEGMRLNLPLLPRKNKAVLGHLLEREPPVMPKYHWDIGDPLSCLEIIFGNGEMFRTGAAAGPGSLEDQWAAGGAQKEAAGPSSASWYRIIQGAQGTMGIVTWASIRCELLPSLEEPFLVGSDNLDKIMEMVHWLIRLRLVNECLVMNNCDLAVIMAKKFPEDYQIIKDSLPTWALFCNIAGYEYLPEKRVSGQIKDMKAAARRAGLETGQALGKVIASELLAAVQCPSREPYWKLRYKGACHDIFFLSLYDKLPEFIRIMQDAADEAGYPASDLGIYLQPVVQGTSCHYEFNLFYNPDNAGDITRVKELSNSVTRKLLNAGAFFSRPYGESAGMIINRDAATAAALKKVKLITDPNNIMNPGKLCF